MKIQQNRGVISTINFSPFNEVEACTNFRSALFSEANSMCKYSPKNHTDVYDESILIFDNYFQALDYLVNIIRAAKNMEENSNMNFCLRSSLCVGNYFMHEDQIYGDAVNLATKLSCSSRENELLICGVDRQTIEEFIDSQNDVTYYVRDPEENCISIGLLDEDTTLTRNKKQEFQIEYNDKVKVFPPSRNQKICIGRSEDSDIFIDHDHISRNHATITLFYDDIYIQDHSANGSYLYFDNREVFLNNDSVQVYGSGYISCGQTKLSGNGLTDMISYQHFSEARSAA
jgi:hypothetical protein